MSRPSVAVSWAVAACALAASTLAGCGVLPAPPGPLETDFVPEVTAAGPTGPPTSDGFSLEQHLAVRIRVATCNGWATGSGWVLSASQVMTNRHVVQGATHIEVTTYDGHVYDVISSRIANEPDLAILDLGFVFTETAKFASIEPSDGQPLRIVGYPKGQALTVEEGAFVDWVPDTLGNSGADVWRLNAHIEPGSSGSAVYNADGVVVAVVYAGDKDSEALAWSADWVDYLIRSPSAWTENTSTGC